MDNQCIMEKTIKLIIENVREFYNNYGFMSILKQDFVSCSFEEKSLTLALAIEKSHLNPYNILHGGAIVSAFDNCCGMLSRYLCEKNGGKGVTINIETKFLKAVKEGTILYIEAKAVAVGKNLITFSCIGWTENKLKPIAIATSTFMIIPKD